MSELNTNIDIECLTKAEEAEEAERVAIREGKFAPMPFKEAPSFSID